MINIRFFEDHTWAGNFTIIVMEGGCPEFRFDTVADASAWVAERAGSIAPEWIPNRFGNFFRHGTIESTEPVQQILTLNDLEVVSSCMWFSQ